MHQNHNDMKFHKEGYPSLALTIAISLALISLAYFVPGEFWIIKPLAILISAFILIVIIQFFRKPNRRMLQMADGIIAPADGKVVVVASFCILERHTSGTTPRQPHRTPRIGALPLARGLRCACRLSVKKSSGVREVPIPKSNQ